MSAADAILLLVSIVLVAAQKGYLRDNCQLPLHHGVQECTNTSSLRYYLDADTETCLAFKYSGCGGNANNFESLSECNLCFASDYSGCPVGSKPVPNLDSSLICENRGNSKCTGPNAYCSRGAFFGHCCDKTIRDKENSDRNPKEGCGPGLKKVQVPMGSFNMALLGKTCDSKFCPEKSTCHQGNYFAYCCTA
uniref:BPTI/Kunitz inhibitor domain-containing protein n=1 Tax=Caenorhabditis japonica TaxID=281687 RepID=A0A8R1DZV2_CAEJA